MSGGIEQDSVRTEIAEIVASVKAGDREGARQRIEHLQREHLTPIFHGPDVDAAERSALVTASLSVGSFDLNRGDTASALIALERTLAAWTRKAKEE